MELQTYGAFALLLLLALNVDAKSVKGATKKSSKTNHEVPSVVVNNGTVYESNKNDYTAVKQNAKVPLVVVNNETVAESNKNDGSGSGLSADEFEDDASGGSAFGEDYNDRGQITQGSGMGFQSNQYQQQQQQQPQQSQLLGPTVTQLLNVQSMGGYGAGGAYGMGMNQPPNPYGMQQGLGFQQNSMQYGQQPFQQQQPQQQYGMGGAWNMPQYSQQQPAASAQSMQASSSNGGCQPSCPSSCAPSCQESCCKTPPVHFPSTPRKIRWKERPRYQPGPPIPPPPLEPAPVYDLTCPSPCSQACAPSCLPSCCASNFPPPPPQMYYPQAPSYPQPAYPQPAAYPPPAAYPQYSSYPQMYPIMSPQSIPYGCSQSCQPQSCGQYCPSHCCATYT